tara:strand:+ start:1707 stop:2663 length:957 start_codon:yes stop_codon:yes gene_type:complete
MSEIEDIVKCTECNSRELEKDGFKGELYCKDCGLVLYEKEIEVVVSGREKQQDPESEKIYDGNREGYFLGSHVGTTMKDGSLDRTRLGRSIRRAERMTLTSSQRSQQRGIIQLNMLCGEMETPRNIREQAIWLYKKLYKENNMGGTSMETRAASILYFTYKDNNINVRIDEICEKNGSHQRQVSKFARKIAIISKKPWVLSRRDVGADISKYCNMLDIHQEVAKEIHILGEYVDKMGEALCLQMGQGWTAGIIYIGVKITGLRSVRTQREIAEVCGITEVTLRNNYRLILDNLGITRKRIEEGNLTAQDIVTGAYKNE